MNEYQKEQLHAWQQIEAALAKMPPSAINAMRNEIKGYLRFREEVEHFLKSYFNDQCTSSCYQNNRSACCSKDGILTFWADLVIDAITADPQHIEMMTAAVESPVFDGKCIYLKADGCCWSVRPLVCIMFLCDSAQQTVFPAEPAALQQWEDLWSRYFSPLHFQLLLYYLQLQRLKREILMLGLMIS